MVTYTQATTRLVSVWHVRIITLACLVLLVGGSFQLLVNAFATSTESNTPAVTSSKSMQYRSGKEGQPACRDDGAPFLYSTSRSGHLHIVSCVAAQSM